MKSKHLYQLNFINHISDKQNSNSVENRIIYNFLSEDRVTFKGSLNALCHSWFRLTPGFSPFLVQKMLSTLECNSKDVILDPFSGSGTTLIECQLTDYQCYGFEINPFLHFVGETSLNWSIDVEELKETMSLISENFVTKDKIVTFDSLNEHNLEIPKIYDPLRWWRQDVLKQLLVLKSCIDLAQCTEETRSFFRLALAAVLVPDLTNVLLGKLQLVFKDREGENIQVFETFATHATRMISEFEKITQEKKHYIKAKTININSHNLDDIQLEKPINCVITSPPYPNRYSYVWNTRPHLFFFDMFSTPKESANLDKQTVGGTWGSATSDLINGEIIPEYKVIEEVIGPVVKNIRDIDNLMANYTMKYFNQLAKQIVEMEKVLSKDARVAYVVGCSRLRGVYIETDVLLAKIFEGLGLGYKISAIERFRKRHSGKDLYESIVYAWK